MIGRNTSTIVMSPAWRCTNDDLVCNLGEHPLFKVGQAFRRDREREAVAGLGLLVQTAYLVLATPTGEIDSYRLDQPNVSSYLFLGLHTGPDRHVPCLSPNAGLPHDTPIS